MVVNVGKYSRAVCHNRDVSGWLEKNFPKLIS